MDTWKFFAISHRDHAVCNPLSLAKVDELVELLDLAPGSRVLDIACGKAEPLVRIAERYDCSGVGVDISPPFVADARAKVAARAPGRFDILEGHGAKFEGEAGSFDVALCLGASFVFGGYRETLRALARWTKPGGLVVSGEPFWKREPDPDYLRGAGLEAGMFRDHAGNVAAALAEGLTPLYAIVSSDDDWDRYEGLQWRAAERWAAANPSDPDVGEVLQRQRAARDLYLRWGRDCLGWAVYVFRR
jgi:SAM-dependent methyltransferase